MSVITPAMPSSPRGQSANASDLLRPCPRRRCGYAGPMLGWSLSPGRVARGSFGVAPGLSRTVSRKRIVPGGRLWFRFLIVLWRRRWASSEFSPAARGIGSSMWVFPQPCSWNTSSNRVWFGRRGDGGPGPARVPPQPARRPGPHVEGLRVVGREGGCGVHRDLSPRRGGGPAALLAAPSAAERAR
jgi:hypothetical protein